MQYSTLVAAAAAMLATVVSAAPHPELLHEDHCRTHCDTTMGGKYPAPYRTSWKTTKLPCVTTTYKTSTCTRTARTHTETETATATSTITATTSTETDTDTVTETDSTTTTTVTTTTSTVSTTTTATTTVPTTAGFIPIETSLPGSSYSGSGGPDPVMKREVETRAKSPAKLPGGVSKKTYCKGVACIKRCRGDCKTVTRTRTTTTVIRPSTTVTSTTTVLTTLYPSATTTVTTTTTSTSTDTETSIQTDTSTSTVEAPTTVTLYAACATSNLADTYNGQIIGDFEGSSDGYVESSAASAYDCCVKAIVGGNAATFGFFPSYQPGYCLSLTVNTCSAQGDVPWQAKLGNRGFGQATLGNGPCGGVYSTS